MEKSNRELLEELGIDLRKIKTTGKTLCPECSHTRKKKNDPCLSVNIDEGWCNCHNCGWARNVSNRKNYEPKKKEYSLPSPINRTDLDDRVVSWFSKRGISQKTLLENDITNGPEWMPQTQKTENTIQFNYIRDGKPVNIKYRDGAKNFKMFKDAELVFYGLDHIKDSEWCVIVEGECFRGDSEILTEKGWVRFDEYNGVDRVLCVDNELKSFFEKPDYNVRKNYSGNLIEYKNSQKFYSITTPEHDLVIINNRNGKISKQKAKDLKTGYSLPRTVIYDGPGIIMEDDDIRLCVAISADFTIREGGDVYGCLKKERKISRIKYLLEKCGVEYSVNLDNRGYHSFFIRRGNAKKQWFKKFPIEWIHQLSLNQKKVIIEELRHWDGNSVPNRNQIEYSTKEIENANFIQTISHTSGICSTIIHRENDFGKWFKVSILFGKKTTDSLSLIKNKSYIEHNGFVYCVKVKTGKILVRQNECISVSGNCDKLAYWESGVREVVSVPNGASKSSNANLEYLDNCIEYFSNKKKIIIATDDDLPGRSLRDELARRLGYHRCYKVDFKGVKDANDFLLINGKLGLKDTVKDENLSEFPIAGTITIDDIWGDVEDLFVNGLQKGDVTKELREFDKLVSFVPGQLMVVTGIPNHGKSPFVLMIAACLSYHHGWKWAFFTPEHKPLKIFVAKICEMLLGKRMRKGVGFTEYEKNLAKDFIREHFVFIEPEGDENKLESILSTAESLVMRKGIRGLVIDPWNKIEHEIPNGDNETNYISRALDKVISFNQRFSVFGIIVAHPTKIRKKAGKTIHEVPTLYDISGSSNWFNKPDWGITYYRNYEEGGKGEVYVQKAKWEHLGSTGVCEVKYNMNNGRFTDYNYDWDNTNWLAPNIQQASLFEDQEKTATFDNTPPDMEDSPF